jgi:hypothetical protein
MRKKGTDDPEVKAMAAANRAHGDWVTEDEDWFYGSDSSTGGLTPNTHAKCKACSEWVYLGFLDTHICTVSL